MSKKHGFTLIELLIVVAIIAILAAIAVPNFLEAQVRSKVSRVKADVRTLAIAVESYLVDHGKPPVGDLQLWKSSGMTYPYDWDGATVADQGPAMQYKWHQWTTPVAYMTSIPSDPFALTGKLSGKAASLSMDSRYVYVAAVDHALNGKSNNSIKSQAELLKNGGITWELYSWGPSRRNTTLDGKSAWVIGGLLNKPTPSPQTQVSQKDVFYDPSNGTTSFGMLIRTNRGIEPAY